MRSLISIDTGNSYNRQNCSPFGFNFETSDVQCSVKLPQDCHGVEKAVKKRSDCRWLENNNNYQLKILFFEAAGLTGNIEHLNLKGVQVLLLQTAEHEKFRSSIVRNCVRII